MLAHFLFCWFLSNRLPHPLSPPHSKNNPEQGKMANIPINLNFYLSKNAVENDNKFDTYVYDCLDKLESEKCHHFSIQSTISTLKAWQEGVRLRMRRHRPKCSRLGLYDFTSCTEESVFWKGISTWKFRASLISDYNIVFFEVGTGFEFI